MAQPSISVDVNTGTQGSPTWTNITLPMSGVGVELRWSDQGNQIATASAGWPGFTRPASGTTNATSFFLYYFNSDNSGNGITGGASPVAFTNNNYFMLRWSDLGNGSYAASPLMTAYDDNTHSAPTSRNSAGFPNNLAGNASDTGATARSYMKANAYGYFGQAPAAAPNSPPAVTDGSTGALTPATNNWLTNYQGLMANIDYISHGQQPANNVAQKWYFMLAMFSGANMATGVYANTVVSMQYTWI